MPRNGKEIQVDDGEFTRIHNDILAALAKARLSGSEFRCLMFLFRKTYGWQKKEDMISLSQWAEGTDTQRPHVLTILSRLVNKNIIYRHLDSGQIPTYGFNKSIEQWQDIEPDHERGKRFKAEPLPEQVTEPKQVTVTIAGNTTVTSTGNKTVTIAGTHKRKKESIKENIKENTEHQNMFGAITKLCRLDPKLKGGQIGKVAKQLLDAGYMPTDVDYFSHWWSQNDFRGRRGETPTMSQLVDKILQSKQEMPQPKAKSTEPVKILLSDGRVVEANA